MGNIKMINGIVLSDGEENFKADEKMVSKSLSYVAKISQGLYSGSLNSDPDFMEFQKRSMNDLIEKEKNNLCSNVVIGAEKQLKRIAEKIIIGKDEKNYIYPRHGFEPVNEIKLEAVDLCPEKLDIVAEEGNRLASMSKKEIDNIKKAVEKQKKKGKSFMHQQMTQPIGEKEIAAKKKYDKEKELRKISKQRTKKKVVKKKKIKNSRRQR